MTLINTMIKREMVVKLVNLTSLSLKEMVVSGWWQLEYSQNLQRNLGKLSNLTFAYFIKWGGSTTN